MRLYYMCLVNNRAEDIISQFQIVTKTLFRSRGYRTWRFDDGISSLIDDVVDPSYSCAYCSIYPSFLP